MTGGSSSMSEKGRPNPPEPAASLEPATRALLMRHLPAALWATDRELRVTALEGRLNMAFAGRERCLGGPLVDTLSDDADRAVLLAAHRRALAGEPANYRLTNGGVTYEAHVEPLRDGAGEIVGVVGVGIDVTEQRRAEERAAESEARLRELAAHAREMFWTTDYAPVPHVTYVSQAFETLFEMPIERAYADPLSFVERVHPEDREHVLEAARRLVHGGPLVTEYRVVGRDGSIRWLCDRSYSVRDASGRTVRAVGITEDVTARRTAEEELRASRRDLLALTENSPDVFTRYDRQHRIRFMSRAVERATGMPAEWYVGRTIHEMGMPESLTASWVAASEGVFRTAEPAELEFESPAPDGRVHVYHTYVVPERGADGTVESVLTTTRDITERRRAEAAARAADATLRSLVEQSLTGIYIIQDGRFRWVNQRFAEIFGYESPKDVLSLDVGSLVHPDDRAMVLENIRRRLAGEMRTLHYAFRGRRRDDSHVHVEVYGSAAEHDARPAVVGTLLDVTEAVRTRDALAASEGRFRALVEHTADLIAIFDADRTMRYGSPAYQRVLGIAAEEMVGRRCTELVHPDEQAAFAELFEEAMRRDRPTAPRVLRVRHADGSWRSLEIMLHDARRDPAVGGIVGNARDVTEQLALEERLRQAQKLEAIGQLAGGVAHDFNNILAAIAGYAQILRDELRPGDPRRADVDEIIASAARGAGVTRQLLAFSRRQAVEMEVLDLGAVVRETGRMLRSLLPASIALELPAEGAAVPVRAARAQLEQIILNLAVNARDAMPRGGRLAFTIARRASSDRVHEAVLTVADTGVGIPVAIRERIFDPFFTTKPLGQGTGLGLATVYGLVRQFGGTVAVESEEGKGTTFVVTLPLASERPEPVRSPVRDDAAPRHHVLLVEDEAAVRTSTTRLLENVGYRVTACASAREALERLGAGERVDVVLTDAAMPETDGHELALRIAGRWPALPVVLMSGYAELTGAEAGAVPGAGAARTGIVGFVEKPFTLRQLVDVLRIAVPGPPTD